MRRLLILIILLLSFSTSFGQFTKDLIVTSPDGIWTDVRAYSTLSAAITAVGSNERTITVVSPQVITSLTIPVNVTLRFERNGSITNSAQFTVNTRGIYASDRQIFTGTGDVVFSLGFVVSPAWFGCKCDGVTDDRLSIQKSINSVSSLGGKVDLLVGTCLVSSFLSSTTILEPKSNITIQGKGDSSVIKIANNMGNFDLFRPLGSALTGAQFRDFKLDGNGTSNLMPPASAYTMAFYYSTTADSNMTFDNILFANLAGANIFLLGNVSTSQISITNCRFANNGDGVVGNTNLTDHSSIYLVGNRNIIANNFFIITTAQSTKSTALEVHGNGVLVDGNYIQGYNIGGIGAAILTNLVGLSFQNNTMRLVQSGFRLYNSGAFIVEDLLVSNNNISAVNGIYSILDFDTGVTTASPLSIVAQGNILQNDSAVIAGDAGFGISLGRSKDVIVKNNTIIKSLSRGIAIGTTNGIQNDESRWQIEGNTCIDCGRTTGAGSFAVAYVFFSANKIKELRLRNNRAINTSGSTPTLKGISGNCTVGQMTVTGNEFVGMGTLDMDWGAAAMDWVHTNHIGTGTPEGNFRGDAGSYWINKSTGDIYHKPLGSTNALTGWLLTRSIIIGAGSPEGVVTAGIGTIYGRTNGGASTTLYVKESGVGNTGWVAK